MIFFSPCRSVVAEKLWVSLVLAASLSIIAGCGSATSGSKAGPITVTVDGGSTVQISSLAMNTSVQLSMSPVGDVANMGVDWTLICGGSPVTGSITGGACGTLAPVHTPAGTATIFTAPGLIPLGSTVTITATLTSDRSQSSSVTLTILPQPPAVNFLDPLANSITVSAQDIVSVVITNDPTNQGVTWSLSCGSSAPGACGTVTALNGSTSSVTYTAPSAVPPGDTVTIKATSVSNPAESVSGTTTILPAKVSTPPAGITVILLPANFYAQTSGLTHITHLTAYVLNDLATGGGVDWTVTCGSSACGSFTPTHTASGVATSYSSPAAIPTGTTVTITATSTAETTESATATGTVIAPTPAPIVVTMSTPPPARLIADGTASLAATVSTGALGVDWTATCGGIACGTFSLSPAHTASGGKITYTAPPTIPSNGVVTITATSPATTPANSASAQTTIQSSVAFTQPPPLTLIVGTPATLAATVANDTGNLGLNWTATCGSTACGIFTPSTHTSSGGTITYTAPATIPAGNMVTITASSPATTPQNIASATTTILVLPPSITFAPAPPTMMAGGTPFTIGAVVANDVAPGGVTWTVKCNNAADGGCGAIVPYQTASGAPAMYTAPPVTASGTTVTITATSISDPVVSFSAPIAIVPNTTASVSFVPAPPGQIQTNAIVNLNAAVANDSTHAGVDWHVCASGCGFFTVKPATTGTAVPYTPPLPAVTATTVSGWPSGLTIPYTAPAQPPSSGIVTVTLAAHADPTKTTSASISISAGVAGTALHGVVRAGTQPVVGASVTLYAAGTSGYASLATALTSPESASVTDKNGNFTVPVGYTCPQPTSQLYVVATGGHVSGNDPNSDLAMMTALGSCNSLSATIIVVNEVTTVASVWSLASFASNELIGGNASYLYLGTSSSNLVGLANAFATVNNLVDITTGQARFNVPAGNAAVPYVEINTIADMLNACAVTAGGSYGDSSPCGMLLSAVTTTSPGNGQPPTGLSSPSNMLQAAFNIAQRPVTSFGYNTPMAPLFALVTPASPFQPVLTAVPNDLSISLNYTSGGGLSSTSKVGSFAIDATGDLWITDTNAGSVIEWNAVGAALSPATGFPAGGGPIAIDDGGNVWITGSGGLVKLTNFGTPYLDSPYAGVTSGGNDMTIDAQGNVWITTGSGIAEFNNFGMEISPSGGFVNAGVLNTASVVVDSTNHVWEANGSPGVLPGLAELSNPGGQLIVNAINRSATNTPFAADASDDLWYGALSFAGLCEIKGASIPPGGGQCNDGGGGGGGSEDLELVNANGVALDGAGTIWVASPGGAGFASTLPPLVMPFIPSFYSVNNFGGTNPGWFVSPTLTAGPLRVAIDGSGNLWVLLANNTVTEYVGLAIPVVEPLALGVKTGKLAAKP